MFSLAYMMVSRKRCRSGSRKSPPSPYSCQKSVLGIAHNQEGSSYSKSVLAIAKNQEGYFEWYEAKLSNKEDGRREDRDIKLLKEGRERLSPIACLKKYGVYKMAVLGSTLYSFFYAGRYNTSPKNVYCCPEPERQWKDGVPMLTRRSLPGVAVLKGKMYVFAGVVCDADGLAPWGEVFDPSLGKWTKLPSPPMCNPPLNVSCVVALEDSNKILVSEKLSDVAMVYNVTTETWEQLDYLICPQTPNWYTSSYHQHQQVAVAGQTLYWYYHGLYAHDLDTKKTYVGVIKGMKWAMEMIDDFDQSYPPSVFHLSGDLFCLAWTDSTVYFGDAYSHLNHSTLYCTKFRVAKGENSQGEGFLRAHAVSFQSYRIQPHVAVEVILMEKSVEVNEEVENKMLIH